jgi:hypothetical protein
MFLEFKKSTFYIFETDDVIVRYKWGLNFYPRKQGVRFSFNHAFYHFKYIVYSMILLFKLKGTLKQL